MSSASPWRAGVTSRNFIWHGERQQISYQYLSIVRARSTNITFHQQRTSISSSSDNFLFMVLPFSFLRPFSRISFSSFSPRHCGLVVLWSQISYPPWLWLHSCLCFLVPLFFFSSRLLWSGGLVVLLIEPFFYPIRHAYRQLPSADPTATSARLHCRQHQSEPFGREDEPQSAAKCRRVYCACILV